MNFFSIEFVVFIIIMFAAYWITPRKNRNIPLLVGGYVFYAFAGIYYIAILAVFTVSSYFLGWVIEGQRSKGQKPKAALTLGILIPLFSLFIFKYLNFVIRVVSDISRSEFNTLKIILPVGISFYTFQVIGYLIDIYRGDEKAEKNFIVYASYLSFFPQLLSGPIARTKTILPQFRNERDFDYDFAVYSLKRLAIGFFQKYFIANRIYAFVDTTPGNVDGYSGGVYLVATILYTFQIYFDFCGYTNMALGFAGLFNIRLDENFKSPYFSQSVRSFWARWHISLTSWFRDYLYIPLGGNRCSKFRNSLNVLIVFLVSGLWHGAGYTFLIWGTMHGAALVIENLAGGKKIKDSKGALGWLRMLVVFAFVTFAWIFFRSPDISTAFDMIGGCFDGLRNPLGYIKSVKAYIDCYEDRSGLLRALFFVIVFGIADYRKLKGKRIDYISGLRTPVRWIIYIIAMFLTMYLVTPGFSEFVYFRF